MVSRLQPGAATGASRIHPPSLGVGEGRVGLTVQVILMAPEFFPDPAVQARSGAPWAQLPRLGWEPGALSGRWGRPPEGCGADRPSPRPRATPPHGSWPKGSREATPLVRENSLSETSRAPALVLASPPRRLPAPRAQSAARLHARRATACPAFRTWSGFQHAWTLRPQAAHRPPPFVWLGPPKHRLSSAARGHHPEREESHAP